MGQRTLFTVGHSTRPWQEFVALLQAWKIKTLVDVRTVPKSRAFPWFSQARMARALPRAGIKYVHLKSLGGLRHAKKDSPNIGWHNASFRGYADYMQTPEFEQGLAELNALRRKERVCIMCSEAVWWRCHRRMIADAEVSRGIPVKHVMSETTAKPHEVTPFARVKKRRGHHAIITYPQAVS
ncbi:MAG TPA: DUF488 domain-containing protein [Pirellulales bacterium]|nr:DUF488 domain-containing protein [Pirellulales bacterium]